MKELIRVFAQIAILRRGPQDLPSSIRLLALTVSAYVVVNLLVDGALPPLKDTALPPITGWWNQVLSTALFTLLWYSVLLRVTGHPERTLQTSSAVFGLETLLFPLLIVSAWLSRRLAAHTMWELPIGVAGLLLLVWLLAANSHIVSAALEWSAPSSVALVILRFIAWQSLIIALFAPGHP